MLDIDTTVRKKQQHGKYCYINWNPLNQQWHFYSLKVDENIELDMNAEGGHYKDTYNFYEIHPFGKHSFEIENFMANLFYLLLLC